MSVVRQIGVNVLTQWAAFVVNGVIGIFLVPFLILNLGRDFYGIATLMGVIVAFATVADLGLRAALGRHLSQALAKGEMNHYSNLASTAFLFWLSMAVILGLLLILVSNPIVELIGISSELAPVAVMLLRSFGVLSLALAFIKPVFSAIFLSHNRFDVLSRIEALSSILIGIGLYLVLGPMGGGIYAWALVMLSVNLVILLLLSWVAFRMTPGLRINPRLASRSSFSELFSFGWQVFLLHLSDLFSMKADPIILTKFLGPAALALYQPGLVLTGKLQPLVMVLANQLLPVTTRYHALSNERLQEQVLFLGTRVTFSLAIGAFVLLGGFSQSIARIWLEGALGPDYRIAGYVVLGWAAVHLIKGSGGSVWPILMAKNRIRFWVYVQVPLAAANVAVSVYLVGFTGLGVVGVVIPTVCIGLLIRLITFFYVCRVFEMTALRYFREAYSRPLLIFVLFGILVVLLDYNAPAGSLFELILLATAAGLVWVAMFFLIAFRWPELGMIIGKIRGRGPLAEMGESEVQK